MLRGQFENYGVPFCNFRNYLFQADILLNILFLFYFFLFNLWYPSLKFYYTDCFKFFYIFDLKFIPFFCTLDLKQNYKFTRK